MDKKKMRGYRRYADSHRIGMASTMGAWLSSVFGLFMWGDYRMFFLIMFMFMMPLSLMHMMKWLFYETMVKLEGKDG